MQQVALASDKYLCYKVQQQAVFITSAGPHGHCSGLTQPTMLGSVRVHLPTDSHIGQSGGKVAILPMQKIDSYCPGVALHALVLGSSGDVQPDPIDPAPSAKSTDSAFQSDPSQKSDKSKSPCMAPRATSIKEQGFSEDQSVRQSGPFLQSGASLIRWTSGHPCKVSG